jgi:hypothetical protein
VLLTVMVAPGSAAVIADTLFAVLPPAEGTRGVYVRPPADDRKAVGDEATTSSDAAASAQHSLMR